jgi:hypothetical protein
MWRAWKGAPPPLHVAFTMQDQIDPSRASFFCNVVRSLLPLIGAVEDVKAEGGRYNPFSTMSEIVLACRAGHKVPKLRAPEEPFNTILAWLHGRKPVVLTLREVDYFSHRNSNLEAWTQLARDIRAAGRDVVIVRDTAKANEPFEDFETCPYASYDVGYRMALYQLAAHNMIVANGPGELLFFSEASYDYFVNIKADDSTTADTWRMNQSIVPGEQWPWSQINQNLWWCDDSYENLARAWKQHQWKPF